MSLPKILVVEDERLVAEDFSNILRGHGFDLCGTAKSGQEALAMAEECRPDLVLMDIVLQGELTGTLAERIKASVTVLEFVSQYVGLGPTARGDIGLCLFHDDHHPSFGVNAESDYWHCFAGCGGGSVIDFYMKWRGCDFPTAIRE